jgi:hypothetical protein
MTTHATRPPYVGAMLTVLGHAERGGVNMSGLCLLVIGIYGGQYAGLFPGVMPALASIVCLVVSLAGLVIVVCEVYFSMEECPGRGDTRKHARNLAPSGLSNE